MNLFPAFTAQLKNAIQFNQKFIFLPKTSFCLQFLKLMFAEGFISSVVEINLGKTLKVCLKYGSTGTPTFKKIKLFSTSGKISYLSYKQLTKMTQGLCVIVISTNEGLLTNQLCLKRRIGGTAICYII